MYLAYLDESGDPGPNPGSPTPTYTVACLFVHDTHWVPVFEDLLRFRRYLRADFGLRMRAEVKANELVKGSGVWASMPYGDQVRKRIYRSFMRLQAKTGMIKTFADAYAAYRKERPDPLFPQTMWDELGPAIVTEANKYHAARGMEYPGIVRGPR